MRISLPLQFSIIINVFITLTTIATAQKGPTYVYNPSLGDVLMRIPADEFLKSAHNMKNSTQLKLYIKPDSTIDGRQYKRPNGVPLPPMYIQVVTENGALKPIKRMAYGFTPDHKKLKFVLLQFSTKQELDDFAAELELKVTETSGSR